MFSQETIATHLNKLSNIALQREHNYRQCLDHDKRRKTENLEYIRHRLWRRVRVSGGLSQVPDILA
jgi:hypothetical protein